MTVETTPRVAGPFAGNNVTSAFPFDFKVFVKADIVVQVTTGAVVTTLVLDAGTGVAYTLALNIDQQADPGGTVTYTVNGVTTALPTGTSLVIGSVVDYTQPIDLTTGGAFSPQVIEDGLDRTTILAQQASEAADRALQVPLGEAISDLPGAAARANKFLVFDLLGNVSTSSGTGSDAGLRADLAAGAGSALVGFTFPGAGGVARTAQSKLGDVISVKDFGAVVDGVTNDSAALFNANTAAVAAKLPLLIPGPLHIGSPVTITATIVDGLHQMFSATSQITINNGQPVRPDWWGDVENTLNAAVNALPATGGTVKLANKRYKPNGHRYGFGVPANSVYFSKDNVSFVGERMPRLSDDCKTLTGGTIIEGQIIAFANNVEFRDLGVDSGFNVMNAYYGGVITPGITGEGLLITYPDDVQKNASALRKGAKLHNVLGLCFDPNVPTHAVIVGEGYSGVVCTGEVQGCYGIHGIVIKCKNVRAQKFTSYCNGVEGVIIKSDAQATAISTDIQIDSILVDADGPLGWSPYAAATTGYGVMFNPQSQAIDRVQIGQIQSYGYQYGIGVNGNFETSNVQIESLTVDQIGTPGAIKVAIQLVSTSAISRFHCANAALRNCNQGIVASFSAGSGQALFGVVDAVNVADVCLDLKGTAYVGFGSLRAQAVGAGIFRITGTPKLMLGQLWRDFAGAGIPTYTNTGGGLVPTLSNGWTEVGGNDTFGIDLSGGRVNLKGLVRPGTSNTLSTLPQWAWPSSTKRLVAQGYNGATQVAVPVVIDTAGTMVVNEVAGGFANVSSWLSLTGLSYDMQVPS